MTDIELLELAAKAAGILTQSWYGNEAYIDGMLSRWNPLTDDGDALRLAVDLGLIVRCYEGSIIVDGGGTSTEEHDLSCRHAATRRAIVCAAAKIEVEK